METRTTRIVVASAVCLLAAAGLLWLIPAQTGDARGATDIAPAFFPNMSLGVCLALGLCLAWDAFRGPREAKRTASAEEESADDDTLTGRALLADMAVWVAASVMAILVLKYAGFIPAGIMLLTGWMLYCGLRSWLLIGLVAIGTPLLLERLSWYVLTIRLP